MKAEIGNIWAETGIQDRLPGHYIDLKQ